jgi:hypothetical protein
MTSRYLLVFGPLPIRRMTGMSIEWDVLKREIFPRGKILIQKQGKTV